MDDLLMRSRSVLLDALEALEEHRDAVIVVGAQAVYLRTGRLTVALAEATKDSDIVVDPRHLGDDPLLETAMRRGGFLPTDQPGAWIDRTGIPVDLMVPEAFAGAGSRSSEIPPHSRNAARRAVGLEAAVVDYSEMDVAALDPDDGRRARVKVAGAAALLVAKLHKIAERLGSGRRLEDKDAHDTYRLLLAVSADAMAEDLQRLLLNKTSAEVTSAACEYLAQHFALGPDAPGAAMAGRAEEGVGDPEQVSVAVSFLAQDVVDALRRRR